MLARVFPRKTNATPTDDYAFVGDPPLFIPDDIDEVHVSVAFSWDLTEADRLAHAWSRVAPVKIGGPATGMRGEAFVPGQYIKPGYVITSRGCPNNCWFCSVPKREGREIRELPVVEGWNVLDDNLLACSDAHIKEVLSMLKRQKERACFTGGLEAKRLRPWHVDLLKSLRPEKILFAFDTPDDWQPLVEAARMFGYSGWSTRHILNAYVLVGYSGDTLLDAEDRCMRVKGLDITPMAMLYRDREGKTSSTWRRFQRAWARPAAIWGKRDLSYLEEVA